jgi:hypothetical protein
MLRRDRLARRLPPGRTAQASWRNARYFRLVPDVSGPRAELVLTPAGDHAVPDSSLRMKAARIMDAAKRGLAPSEGRATPRRPCPADLQVSRAVTDAFLGQVAVLLIRVHVAGGSSASIRRLASAIHSARSSGDRDEVARPARISSSCS